MEVNSEFDIKDYDSIKKYLLPNYTFIHILALFILLFSIFTNHLLVGFIIGIAGIIVMETLLLISKKRLTNVMYDRINQSMNGKDKLYINLIFDEDTITSKSLNTESTMTIPYTDIKKLVVKEKYSFLYTFANTFLILETSKIKDNDIENFLLNKNYNIQIK